MYLEVYESAHGVGEGVDAWWAVQLDRCSPRQQHVGCRIRHCQQHAYTQQKQIANRQLMSGPLPMAPFLFEPLNTSLRSFLMIFKGHIMLYRAVCLIYCALARHIANAVDALTG